MSILDIAQIIFIAAVVIIGLGGIIFVLKQDKSVS